MNALGGAYEQIGGRGAPFEFETHRRRELGLDL